MSWFEKLTGFRETSASEVHKNCSLQDGVLTSHVNGRQFVCGRLQTPLLSDLRAAVATIPSPHARLRVREVIADAQGLHADPRNAGALFQVASQFNLLEMMHPAVTPEEGVSGYENDHTQGPACAIAAGAGTIYRNYFVPINGGQGQSTDTQIDCLVAVGRALGNSNEGLWRMRNGYALPTEEGLRRISEKIRALEPHERDELRSLLRIGVQWGTQVTLDNCSHTVTQAYCSALPVAYCRYPREMWEDFARLVLEASYESTLCTAVLNSCKTGNNKVFLTLIGGGAFGNSVDWITDSMKRALAIFREWDLDVAIVSYRQSSPAVGQLLRELQ